MDKYLNTYDFNFIINLFNTYPEQLVIEFFIKNQIDYDFFNKVFTKNLNCVDIHKSNLDSYNIFISKSGVKLSLIKRDKPDMRRHLRGNIIVCSNEYPLVEIEEVYKPLNNLHPCLGFLYYDSSFLKEYYKEQEIVNSLLKKYWRMIND